MPIVKLTSITCNGFTEPLQVELFLENNSFSPSSGVDINSNGPIPLDKEAYYDTDAQIVIYKDNLPILQSNRSFTLLLGGPGSTYFHGYETRADLYNFFVEYDVKNDPFTLTFAYIVATFRFVESLFWVILFPWRYLSFGRSNRLKRNLNQD